MKKRVKIECEDGYTLKVTDKETGQEIRHITSLVYKQEYGAPTHGMPECTIKVHTPKLDIQTDAKIITMCPACEKRI